MNGYQLYQKHVSKIAALSEAERERDEAIAEKDQMEIVTLEHAKRYERYKAALEKIAKPVPTARQNTPITYLQSIAREALGGGGMSESHCTKHNWYQSRIPLSTGCPFCAIAALEAENEKYRTALNRIADTRQCNIASQGYACQEIAMEALK